MFIYTKLHNLVCELSNIAIYKLIYYPLFVLKWILLFFLIKSSNKYDTLFNNKYTGPSIYVNMSGSTIADVYK